MMQENKLTPVEWLYDIIVRRNTPVLKFRDCLEQAKQKEQEQKQELLVGFLYWFGKVTANNPMAFETDHEDIASMYLNGFYPECKKPEHNE